VNKDVTGISAFQRRFGRDLGHPFAIKAILCALLVAVVIRVVLLVFVPLPPTVSDAAGYDTAARRLALGESYRFPIGAERPSGDPLIGASFQSFLQRAPNALVMPGYPEFVSVIYRVSGSGPQRLLAVAIVQSVLGVFVVGLVALVAWRVGTRLEAVIAAFLAALYLPFAWINNAVMSETVFSVILLVLALVAVEALRSNKLWLFAVFGVLTGAASYLRPTVSLWPVVVFALMSLWWTEDVGLRPALVRVGTGLLVFGLAAVLVGAPWVVRNEMIYSKVIPLTTIGAKPGYEFDLAALKRPFPHDLDYDVMSDLELGQLSAERDHVLRASLSPGEITRIVALRAWNSLWSLLLPFDLGSHYLGLKSGAQMMKSPLVIVPQVMLVGMAMLGVWFGRKRREILLLATIPGYFWVVHALTYPSARYMLPSMLVLSVLGATGFSSIVREC
jgi:4-amino-4-deoxy-L-arabinose transferase-like glycosyltransferase